MSKNDKKMLLRFPFDLHLWFKIYCVKNEVSMNDMLVKLLYDLKKSFDIR